MKNNKVYNMVVNSLLIALVFVATSVIKIQLPISNTGGLIHMGNVALFTIALVFGKNKGAISGAFGMALFDILSPYAVWAPFTFVIRGVMGYIIGYIAYKNNKSGNSVLYNGIAIIVSSIWMIVGYFTANIILYRNIPAAISSIPGDIIQIVIGIMVAVPLTKLLKSIGIQKLVSKS